MILMKYNFRSTLDPQAYLKCAAPQSSDGRIIASQIVENILKKISKLIIYSLTYTLFLFVPQDPQIAPTDYLIVPKVAMNKKRGQLERSLI